MSNPILFNSTETEFQTMGFGFLSDCTRCIVTEERNGSYELEMDYPVTGIHFEDIIQRRLIYAKPNYLDNYQAFRVYHITKSMGGIVTIYAQHISYDMSGYIVAPFSADNISGALSGLISNSLLHCPFSLTTTRSTSAAFKVAVPSSVRSWLGGKEGSLLDVYGGEWHFDMFKASLENNRGADHGVVIRYGKNLIDLKQEENCSNVYTGVIGYWTDPDGNEVHGSIVNASGTYNFTRILSVDFSQEFQSKPTIEELNKKSAAYIADNNIGIPNVDLTVSFVQNDTSDQIIYYTDNEGNFLTDNSGNVFAHTYKGVNTAVNLCDIVTVYFPVYGVNAKAKCIKTVWNVLLDAYDSVELGNASSNLATTIADIKQKTKDIVSTTVMELAINNATKLISGNKGGYIILHDSDSDGYPDELLIMDTPSISTSTKIWRYNKKGFGYSSTGYQGPFNLAITADGAIVADFITAGILNGSVIKAGVIKDSSGVNYWDLDNGIFHMGLSEYFAIQPDGSVLIGNDNASMKLVLSSNRISFFDNGIEVAYISNKQLHIASSEVFESLAIDNGLDSDGYWQFHMRENGHLSLNYIDK
jgi:phage minor structural protein